MIIVWYYWCHIILNCRLITSALGRSLGRWQLNRFWISFLNTVGLCLDVTIKVSLLDHKNEKFKFSKTLFKNTFLVIQRFKLFTMLLSLNSTLEAVLSGPPQNLYRSSINTVIKKSRLSKTKLKVFFQRWFRPHWIWFMENYDKMLSFNAFFEYDSHEFINTWVHMNALTAWEGNFILIKRCLCAAFNF